MQRTSRLTVEARSPVTFQVNVQIELEDANGAIVFATVKHIASRVTLLQFTRRPLSPDAN